MGVSLALAGLLPFITWAALVAAIHLRFPLWGWKKAILRATVAWGVYLVVATETLSLVHGLIPPVLGLVWVAPTLGFTLAIHRWSTASGRHLVPRVAWPEAWTGRASLVVITMIGLVTAVLAWVSPPNTWDSLTYHMSRVAHWAQNASLEPFATGILRQAYMSPGAEMVVLHLYVLGGGDRLANFAQWFAMVVCLVGAAKIARDLGATSSGQWLASLFVATLPMGIAQSSSTMTDYVVALWVVCAAAEASEVIASSPMWDNMAAMALAAGLALLTKPTGAVFLAPFALLGAWVLVRRFPPKQMLALGLLALLSVIGLNLGYVSRNFEVFGAPFGSASVTGMFTNSAVSWRIVVSNLLRNASLHAGTSWRWLNEQLLLALAKVHWKLGLALDDPRTSWHGFFMVRAPTMGESMVGNTPQAVLSLLATGMCLALRNHRTRARMVYVGLVVASFVSFSTVFKFDMLGSRYHMPFFVLLGPIVGVIFGASRGWSRLILVVYLTAAAYRPLLQLEERPFLSMPDHPSVFLQPREELYLSDSALYRRFTADIQATGCTALGLMLLGDTPEYPIWVFMGAPRDGLTVDWIISRSDPTGKYRLQDFKPCAVICQECPTDWVTLNGIPFRYESQGFQLYLGGSPSE